MKIMKSILFALALILLVVIYIFKPQYDGKLDQNLWGMYCYEGRAVELRDKSAIFISDEGFEGKLEFTPNHDNFGWLLDTGGSVQIGSARGGEFVFGEGTRMMRIDEEGNLLVPKFGGGSITFEECRTKLGAVRLNGPVGENAPIEVAP